MKQLKNTIDKQQVLHNFNRAAPNYQQHAWLQEQIATSLDQRLDYIKIKPEVVLDLGSGTGFLTRKIKSRYPKAKVLGLDFAENMLLQGKKQDRLFRKNHWLQADIEQLPLQDHSVDLIVSNCSLQWLDDLAATFSEAKRVLRPNGLFLFTTFGPDTLIELRQSFRAIDQFDHINDFTDMHLIGDLLQQQQFTWPVMDMEYVHLEYSDVLALMKSIKAIGASHHRRIKRPGLMGKQSLAKLTQAYGQQDRSMISATFEVVYGHAWSPQARTSRAANTSAEISIPIDSIRRNK